MNDSTLKLIRKEIDPFIRKRKKILELIALRPIEEQLLYFFNFYGWHIVKTLPPDQEETFMYIYVHRIPGRDCYCVPEIPKHHLTLIDVTHDTFCFAVDPINA